MDKEKLDRANFLRGKIESIEDFISVHKNNVRMNIQSSGTISTDRDCSISLEKNVKKKLLLCLLNGVTNIKKNLKNYDKDKRIDAQKLGVGRS